MLVQKKAIFCIIVFLAIGTACLAADIHQAAKDGHPDEVKAWLDKDPAVANASEGSHEEVIELLRAEGAKGMKDTQKKPEKSGGKHENSGCPV